MSTARALACAAGASAALAACGVLPSPPPPLQTDFIPEATASALPTGELSLDGFSHEEQMAVRLRVETCDGWATGSGWILNESQIVTNQHVIDNATHIEITTYDGKDYVALSSAVAPVADIGLVTVDPVFTSFAPWTEDEPEPGDEVTVVGYPDGQALTVENGYFQSDTLDDVGNTGEYVYFMQAHVEPGSSGSAVYNADGEVFGILYAGDEADGSLAWPTSYLAELLADPSGWVPNTPSC